MTASSLTGSRVSACAALWLAALFSPVWGPIAAPSLLGQEPTPSVRVWEGTLSLPTYAEGVAAAQSQRRPLLLWAMNGHPLGCT